jgi:16S rRNA (cytosine1402-N4)-methyltransferase
MSRASSRHVPVLAAEVLQWLDLGPGQLAVDGTLGGGGHTRLLAERVSPGGQVLALDRDETAVEGARQSLAGLPVRPIHASFRDLADVIVQSGREAADAILLDLGVSSDQLADAERGFSFDAGGPLDLRFDRGQGEPAWRLVARLDAERLANVIYEFGEERNSRRIARAIVEARRDRPMRTAAELAAIVRRSVPKPRGRPGIDPATRTFQALRIAVNDELGALRDVLAAIPNCLRAGGRVAIISFHSLEDRLVKEAFRDDPRYEVLTKKPIRPGEAEVAANVRSRSAKMRVARRAEG